MDVFESNNTLIGGNVNDAVTRRQYSITSLLRDGTKGVTPFHDVPLYSDVKQLRRTTGNNPNRGVLVGGGSGGSGSFRED